MIQATRHERTAHGGMTVYGARVGILMPDTLFPRIPGDMCNALTWPFPVLFKVVRNATAASVAERSQSMREDFMAAGEELVAEGADGITTNVGYLSLFQDELAARCGVPVAASSLMQIPFIGDNDTRMDVAAAERDLLDAGHDLVGRHPEVGAVVLECTNMTPYARAMSEALALPVYSIYSFVCWFHGGLAPRDFGHPGSARREWRG